MREKRAKIWGVMHDLAYFSRFLRDEQILMIFMIAWLEEKFCVTAWFGTPLGGLIHPIVFEQIVFMLFYPLLSRLNRQLADQV